MSENVPIKISNDNIFGNMITDSDINSIDEIENLKNSQNIRNSQVININSTNPNIISFSNKTKFKIKNLNKSKVDVSKAIKTKIKNSICFRNSLKFKNKNKSENEDFQKLSINKKINQSNASFNESIKESKSNINENTISKINEINNKNEDENMKIEYNNNTNTNVYNFNNSIINNEINFQYITDKVPALTSMTYNEFNSNIPAFEYINDIWESFIEKEKYNSYSYKDILLIQTDIKESMRGILVDWIISLQNKFFSKPKTLFLTINLIDRYLSKKQILRNRFQLLGVTSLFISFKFEEINIRKIEEFSYITVYAFNKSEILEMEKDIIDLVNFNLDLPLCNDFFDLLSTVYKFNEKEYNFGYFLLEAFLFDMKCCEYKQSQIALATCFIILQQRSMENMNFIEENNFIKYYSNQYKINLDIWNDYDNIVNCAKKIYIYFEQKEDVNFKDREVYKIFNYIFI